MQRGVVESDVGPAAEDRDGGGTAPPARTAFSISRATDRLSGRGNPWLMMVLSNATTARPAASASATSG